MILSMRSRARSGASVVEFALVGPLFFLIVLGLVEVGRAFMVQHLLTDAARHGCRFAAIIEGTTTQTIKDTVTTYLAGFGIDAETVTVTINDGSGNVTEAQNVPAYSEMTVTASIPASSITWLPTGVTIWLPGIGTVPVSMGGTLSGQFTMRRE
jgi:Flp pilus assembly protein TadG